MKTTINVKQLSASYGNKKVLNDITFSIKKGEIFGLLGVNGAGKTTTIECVLGLKKPDTGSIRILGMEPTKDRKELFQHISVQFQESHYQDKIKVKEICEVTTSLYRNSVDYMDLLKQFHIADKLSSTLGELSGGQKQKLCIVLALIPNPTLVFLDELTTGLDPKARREVWQSLLALKEKGLTICLTSHFMDEVEVLCDRIGILNKGSFIFEGTTSKAIESSPYDNLEDAYIWYTEKEDI